MPLNPLTGLTQDTYGKFKNERYYLFGGINAKASAYVNQQTEFRDISNLNFLYPGALTKRPGSTLAMGATVSGGILGGTEFQRLNGNSMIVFFANTNLYTVNPPGVPSPVVTNLSAGAFFNFVTFVDRLFCCNGNSFFKFDGANNYLFSLPPGATASWGVTYGAGGSLVQSGQTGIFSCAYGYVNERGYLGPVSNAMTLIIAGTTVAGGSIINSITYYGMTNPFSGYGMTAIQLWRTSPTGTDLYGTTFAVLGATQITDTGFPLGTSLAIPHLWFTMIPRYQAVFNNQLFLGGFSQFPSRVYWSEIGEPEAIQPNYYADFRTNDGDRLSGLKVYNAQLIAGKLKSLHRVTGDNPTNFAISQISEEYGNLSNNAMVVFENLFWCLDEKGLVQYDGSNIGMISDKPEPFFLQMNVPYAVDNAQAVHYKYYNEVWFHIPLYGATLNSHLIAYDYAVQAWTRYDGIQAQTIFGARGGQPVKTVFYGGYTGGLFYMGPTFYGDNGNAITCMCFTAFMAPSGQTIENMYRRFWADVDPVLGITQAINVNLYSNYNSTQVAFTGSIFQSVYQTRIDFGISARTMAAQLMHVSASLPFKLNAYTFESRYQRSV